MARVYLSDPGDGDEITVIIRLRRGEPLNGDTSADAALAKLGKHGWQAVLEEMIALQLEEKVIATAIRANNRHLTLEYRIETRRRRFLRVVEDGDEKKVIAEFALPESVEKGAFYASQTYRRGD